jgi:hypothetical protein
MSWPGTVCADTSFGDVSASVITAPSFVQAVKRSKTVTAIMKGINVFFMEATSRIMPLYHKNNPFSEKVAEN